MPARILFVLSLSLLTSAVAVAARRQGGRPVVSASFGRSSLQDDKLSLREQRLLAIQELIGRGDLSAARQLIEQSRRQYPKDGGFDNLLGVIEAQAGNYEAAEAAFTRAVARAPQLLAAHLNLGRLYIERSASDPSAKEKALAAYRRALHIQPANAEAHYQSAVLLVAGGELQAALKHLARLPADRQQSAQAIAVGCAAFAGLGNIARADDFAARLLAHPDFSEADVFTALPTLEANRRDDLAVRLLAALADRQLASAEALRRLGLLYERQGKLDEARTALEKSAAAARPRVTLLVDLARVARAQKDYQGALGYLAYARDLEPHDAELHYLFGLVCVDARLAAEAHLAFGKAVALAPQNATYNFSMGAVSAFRADPSEAVPYFQKYLQLKPDDVRGHLALGAVYLKAKDFVAARRELSVAVRSTAVATTAHFYLGSLARQAGQLDEAVRELKLALAANPHYTDALAELGQVHLQRRDYKAAEEYLRRALALNADHYAANFGLVTLYSRTNDVRREKQVHRFDELQKRREAEALELLRVIEIRTGEK